MSLVPINVCPDKDKCRYRQSGKCYFWHNDKDCKLGFGCPNKSLPFPCNKNHPILSNTFCLKKENCLFKLCCDKIHDKQLMEKWQLEWYEKENKKEVEEGLQKRAFLILRYEEEIRVRREARLLEEKLAKERKDKEEKELKERKEKERLRKEKELELMARNARLKKIQDAKIQEVLRKMEAKNSLDTPKET